MRKGKNEGGKMWWSSGLIDRSVFPHPSQSALFRSLSSAIKPKNERTLMELKVQYASLSLSPLLRTKSSHDPTPVCCAGDPGEPA